MEDQFVTKETAKLAKEKGFDEGCLKSITRIESNNYEFINTNIKSKSLNWLDHLTHNSKSKEVQVPTQSLLQRWLREKHRIDITVLTEWKEGIRFYRVGFSYVSKENKIEIWFSREEDERLKNYGAFESALEEGLKEGLKLIS